MITTVTYTRALCMYVMSNVTTNYYSPCLTRNLDYHGNAREGMPDM